MSLLTSLFSFITYVDYFLRCTPIVHSLSQFLMLFLRSFYLRVYLRLFGFSLEAFVITVVSYIYVTCCNYYFSFAIS